MSIHTILGAGGAVADTLVPRAAGSSPARPACVPPSVSPGGGRWSGLAPRSYLYPPGYYQ